MHEEPYTIRTLQPGDTIELDAVTRMCMETVLETIPEFGGSAAAALAQLPNFTFEQMRAMLATSAANEDHRILAVIDGSTVVGYSIFSVKIDEQGVRYGYLFSRGVAVSHRRRGIAARLLEDAHSWFRSRRAQYSRAETHVSNAAALSLFRSHGYRAQGPFKAAWEYYVLEKSL